MMSGNNNDKYKAPDWIKGLPGGEAGFTESQASLDLKKEQDMILAQQEAEKKKIRDKQIRMLRSNFRNPLLQSSPRGLDLGNTPGLKNTLGG